MKKNALTMMETPPSMFRNLCKEIETKFIGAKLDSKEKQENGKERLII